MSKSKELQKFFSKGYGTISKSIMTDTSFNLESKSIFAYFCALAGSGNKTFPYRSTIIKQLGISKNTYYKHLKDLIKRGLISVKISSSRASNTYTINSSQKDNKGYGLISREIMQDDRLCIKAKGLYAYICSLSGKNNHSFPSKKQILKQLNISEPTYYNCLNQLKECGYVFTQQRKVLGRFSINDYYLYSLPSASPLPSPDAGDNKKQRTKKWDTPHTNIWDNKNRDTYLTTSLSFLSNNNLSIKHSDTTPKMTDSDPLKNFTVNLINRFFPDAPHNNIINEFLPKFCNSIKGKNIIYLSAYMKSSINKFLEETALKANINKKSYGSIDMDELQSQFNKGDLYKKSSSYDLAEIEALLCSETL